MYKVSESEGFELLAEPTHYEAEDILKMGDHWPHDWQKNIQRILYIGDNLYTVSPEKIKATDLLSGEEKGVAEFK